jgi:acyl dehydratase
MSTSVSVGEKLPEWVIEAVSPEKMKTFAPILADPNPIHFDLASVRALGMGDKPINQGPSNLGYVMNMLVQWSGGPQHLRSIAVRFQANVLGGQRVVARGTVNELTRVNGRLLAGCDVELVAGEDEAVALSGTALVDVTDLAAKAAS